MLYFDTSFLAPLILPEATSEAVAGFLAGLPGGELVVSHWTCVEFASLLGREVRMGGLKPGEATRAADRFQAMVEASFAVLAIAKNHGADAIYSLDKTLLRAGRRLGLPTSTGIRLSGYED